MALDFIPKNFFRKFFCKKTEVNKKGITFIVEPKPSLVLPTPKTSRKYPSRVTTLPDQIDKFNDFDEISDFSSIDDSLCPSVYQLQVDEN